MTRTARAAGPDRLRARRRDRTPKTTGTSGRAGAASAKTVEPVRRRGPSPFGAVRFVWRHTLGALVRRIAALRRRNKIILAGLVVLLIAAAGLSLDEQQRSELDSAWWFDQGGVTTPVGYQQTMADQAPWAARILDPDNPALSRLLALGTDAWGPLLQDRCTGSESGVWLPWLKGERSSTCSNDVVAHHAERMAWDADAWVAITAARVCEHPRGEANWTPVVSQYQALGADMGQAASALTALEVEIRTAAHARKTGGPCTQGGIPALATALGIDLTTSGSAQERNQ